MQSAATYASSARFAVEEQTSTAHHHFSLTLNKPITVHDRRPPEAPRSRRASAGVVDVCIGVDVVLRVGMGVGVVTGVVAGIMNKK